MRPRGDVEVYVQVIQQWASARYRWNVIATNVDEQCRDWRKELSDDCRRCSRDGWFQSIIVRRKNENRYGFLRADNAVNVMSSADLVFRSGF